MPELVCPDGLDDVPARLARVDQEVRGEDHAEPDERDARVRNEQEWNERDRVDAHVVEKHLPALALFHHHPDALEGKVAEEVAGGKQEKLRREGSKHGTSLSGGWESSSTITSTKNLPRAIDESADNEMLNLSKISTTF